MKKVRLLFVLAFVLSLTLFSHVTWAAIWSVPGDFTTIQDAIYHSNTGDTIMVGPGNHFGALVDKSVTIKGTDGAIINDGPAHSSGLSQGFRLLAGSEGATISHLTFEVDLAIMNGDAVDDVTVTQCTFKNTIQAVSNWRGSGWEISHNNIYDLRTMCGGGIGILVADFSGGIVKDNVVSHNKIMGTLHVAEGDCGEYNGSGIVLYADFRWNMAGAEHIMNNRVVKNKVSLVSDNPIVVDVAAFELTDTQSVVDSCDIIHDNAIGFNDFRGTDPALQIALTPENLDTCNKISRNMGDNRGHGLHHPSAFGPGGN